MGGHRSVTSGADLRLPTSGSTLARRGVDTGANPPARWFFSCESCQRWGGRQETRAQVLAFLASESKHRVFRGPLSDNLFTSLRDRVLSGCLSRSASLWPVMATFKP